MVDQSTNSRSSGIPINTGSGSMSRFTFRVGSGGHFPRVSWIVSQAVPVLPQDIEELTDFLEVGTR
jgi:hypothetical protein